MVEGYCHEAYQLSGMNRVPPSHQNKIPRHFPEIPGRILKIPDGASSVYHFSGRLQLPYTDPVPSPFNASISPFRHIQYLQLLYLSDSFFLFSRCVYYHLQMQIINVLLAKGYENVMLAPKTK